MLRRKVSFAGLIDYTNVNLLWVLDSKLNTTLAFNGEEMFPNSNAAGIPNVIKKQAIKSYLRIKASNEVKKN